MSDLLEKWQKFRERATGPLMTFVLVVALLVSTLVNLGVLPVNAEWVTTAMLLALLVLQDQLQSLRRMVRGAPFRVYGAQDDSYLNDMSSFIAEGKVEGVQLIEYSTQTIGPLLESLVTRANSIQLLLGHPESAPNDYQRKRIEQGLKHLASLREAHSSVKFEIMCYRPTAALRGRKFGDDLISVGWYTYGTRRVEESELAEPLKQERRPQEIHGQGNPMVNAELSTPQGRALERMFDRVFRDLKSKAIPLDRVLKELSVGSGSDGSAVEPAVGSNRGAV